MIEIKKVNYDNAHTSGCETNRLVFYEVVNNVKGTC